MTKTKDEQKSEADENVKPDNVIVKKGTKRAKAVVPAAPTRVLPKREAKKEEPPKRAAAKPASKPAAKKAAPKKAFATKKAPAKKAAAKKQSTSEPEAEHKAEAKDEQKQSDEVDAGAPAPADKQDAEESKKGKEKEKETEPEKKEKGKAAEKRKESDSDIQQPAAKRRKTSSKAELEAAKPTITVPLAPYADVLVLGSGEVGQLGLGTSILGRKRPHAVPPFTSKRVLKLLAGGLHNGVLVQNSDDVLDTSLWTWGCNDNKILGRSTPIQQNADVDLSMVPAVVPELEGKHIVSIASGEYHFAALSNIGSLYLWGTYKEEEGFLGYSEKQPTEQDTPRIFPGLEDVTIQQVASGHNHTLALTSTGSVLIWGFYWLGVRVSDRQKRAHLRPSAVTFPKNKARKEPKVKFVAAGGYHSFAITEDGIVFAWGLNNHGQLGIGHKENEGVPKEVTGLTGKNIVSVHGGQHHSLALSADGKVYAFGKGEYGQLGVGSRDPSDVPVEITFFTEYTQNTGDSIKEISTSDNHCVAVTKNGVLFAWGFGDRGQLGNATRDDEGSDALTPFRVEGPQIRDRIVLNASAGGQHTALLASPPTQAATTATTAATTATTTATATATAAITTNSNTPASTNNAAPAVVDAAKAQQPEPQPAASTSTSTEPAPAPAPAPASVSAPSQPANTSAQ